jgi:hypothetical protein
MGGEKEGRKGRKINRRRKRKEGRKKGKTLVGMEERGETLAKRSRSSNPILKGLRGSLLALSIQIQGGRERERERKGIKRSRPWEIEELWGRRGGGKTSE